MTTIIKQDTDGNKPLLDKGELGYDDYAAGGDQGRVYVGTGSANVPLAEEEELESGLAASNAAIIDNMNRYLALKDYVNSISPSKELDIYEILSSIKDVDGSGSGLDADKVDGFDATQTPASNSIPVSDTNGYLNNWIDINSLNVSLGVIKSSNDPTRSDLYPIGTRWVNTNTGNIWACLYNNGTNTAWKSVFGGCIGLKIGTLDFFRDGSGVALYQLDGNANDTGGVYNGTAYNVIYDDGKFGQAAVFNGVDSKIDTGYKTSNSNNTYSISAWVKRNSTDTQDSIYAEGDTTYNSYGSYLTLEGNFIYAGHYKYSTSVFDNVGGDITGFVNSMTDWMHICFTRENGVEHKLYINGVLFNTVPCSNVTSASTYTGEIGHNSHYIGVNRAFSGSIDQFRIFNRALTNDEVQKLYNEF